jgi:hypothetical protein
MVLLKKALPPLLAGLIFAQGCSSSVTLVSLVDTDTYISSTDSSNHSELPSLRVSNTPGGTEERALLKLPTGQEDPNYNLSQIFGNLSDPVTWPLLPFVIVFDIFASFFNCTGQTLAPLNLQSAYLVLNVGSNAGGAALSELSLQTLSKPWWQTVSWTQAFPFSGKGAWAQAGGDLDSTFTPIAGSTPDSGVTVQFDVTSYFRQLLQNQTQPHYGFLIRSAGGASLTPIVLNSVQFGNSSVQPRLVSQYNCIAPITSMELAAPAAQATKTAEIAPYTYYLGRPHGAE